MSISTLATPTEEVNAAEQIHNPTAGNGTDTEAHNGAASSPEQPGTDAPPVTDRFDHIPEELKSLRQFVNWRLEKDPKGKLTKVPYIAGTQQRASSTDPKTWQSFSDVVRAFRDSPTGFFNGIGVVMTTELGIVGIDLDHCIDPVTEEIEPWAQAIVTRFSQTYRERSPSGLGLRSFVKGTLPPHGRKKGPIELYNSGRFLTLTGNRLDDAPGTISAEYAEEMLAFHAETFKQKEQSKKTGATNSHDPRNGQGFLGSDDELLATARNAQNGPAFSILYDDGAWSGGYPSQSEAELALCNHLAFWCGPDSARIDRLFRLSKLFRSKWDDSHFADGRTYGAATVEKALAGVRQFYQAHNHDAPSDADTEDDTTEDRLEKGRAALDAIIQDAKDQHTPPKQVLSSIYNNTATLLLLARLHGPNYGLVFNFLMELHGLGVTKEETKKLERKIEAIAKQTSQKKAADHHTAGRLVRSVLPDAPVPGNAVVPDGYALSAHATKEAHTGENGEPVFVTIAPAPIVQSGRMKDVADETESVRLSWFRDNRWQNKTTDRANIASARLIVDLSALGFPVTSVTAKETVRYLARYEAQNLNLLPKARVSHQLGWIGKDGKLGFLWGRSLITDTGDQSAAVDLDTLAPEDWREDFVAFHGTDRGDSQLADGFHAQGSWEGWLKAVTPIVKYPRVLLALYASLTPPLLEILGARNFCIDWCGPTSEGKTTTLRVAASVWGCPEERETSVLHTWDSTRVWIERAAAVLNSLPLILDDTKRAKQPKLVAQTLYDVTSGEGRGRGSLQGLRNQGKWKTIGLFTGEAPATSFTEDGGTRARVLTLWGPPFDTADDTTGSIVDALSLGIGEHFGHAGPRFVSYLAKNRDKWGEWRDRYQFAKSVYAAKAQDNPVARRFAEYFATLDVTAQLAHEALELPWEYADPIASLWDVLTREAGEADRAAAALSQVVSWAYSHLQDFHGRAPWHDGEPKQPSNGFAGRWDKEDGWEFIAFYPSKINGILTEMDFDPEQILRTWRDRGWLEVGKDEKRQQKKTRMSEQGSTWAVVIKREAIEALNTKEETPQAA